MKTICYIQLDNDDYQQQQELLLIQQQHRQQPRLADFPPTALEVAEAAAANNVHNSGSGAGFTDDEVQNLKDIFDLFDKERSGSIDVRDLEAIMTSLQRDPSEARAMLGNHDRQSVSF